MLEAVFGFDLRDIPKSISPLVDALDRTKLRSAVSLDQNECFCALQCWLGALWTVPLSADAKSNLLMV